MKAMIQNDADKTWMLPLLELRNELDFRGDSQRERDIERREFRRLRGRPELNRNGESLIPGPYTQEARAWWLKRLLEAQTKIRDNPNAPMHVRTIELISQKELQCIRRIWLEDKHEIEDLLPGIYEEATHDMYPNSQDEAPCFERDALDLLREVAAGDSIHYETLRNLLHIEYMFRRGGTAIARRGLFKELEAAIQTGFFENKEDALAWAKTHAVTAIEGVSGHPDYRLQSSSAQSPSGEIAIGRVPANNESAELEHESAI
jgi:DNA sulfur modification protein DndC